MCTADTANHVICIYNTHMRTYTNRGSNFSSHKISAVVLLITKRDYSDNGSQG